MSLRQSGNISSTTLFYSHPSQTSSLQNIQRDKKTISLVFQTCCRSWECSVSCHQQSKVSLNGWYSVGHSPWETVGLTWMELTAFSSVIFVFLPEPQQILPDDTERIWLSCKRDEQPQGNSRQIKVGGRILTLCNIRWTGKGRWW